MTRLHTDVALLLRVAADRRAAPALLPLLGVLERDLASLASAE
jgi:hypothetical protein